MNANKHTNEAQANSTDMQAGCAQVDAHAASVEQPCLKHADGAQAGKCCCHYKETERTEKLQTDVKKRLNRAIGQLNGVKNMIDNNRYCGDVLTQLAAAESAVHSAAEMILRDHLETCVKDRIRQGDDEIIEEAMRLIKKFARS